MNIKMIPFFLLLSVLILPCLFYGESGVPETPSEKGKIIQILDRSIEYLLGVQKDAQMTSGSNKDTGLFIGPFGKAVVVSADVIPFWPDDSFRYISHHTKNLHLVFSQKGDTAWFYELLHLHFSSENRSEDWLDLRRSGTLLNRNGEWRLILQHISVPASESGYAVTKEPQFQKWGSSKYDSEEYNTVEETIRNSIGWVKNKDLKLLYGIIQDSPEFLEIHPEDNIVRGIEQFRRNERFWMNPDFTHVSFDISNLRIVFSPEKDTAVFYCVLNDRNKWQGRLMSWENARWTGFLEKIDGKWRLWHSHFSYAVLPEGEK